MGRARLEILYGGRSARPSRKAGALPTRWRWLADKAGEVPQRGGRSWNRRATQKRCYVLDEGFSLQPEPTLTCWGMRCHRSTVHWNNTSVRASHKTRRCRRIRARLSHAKDMDRIELIELMVQYGNLGWSEAETIRSYNRIRNSTVVFCHSGINVLPYMPRIRLA